MAIAIIPARFGSTRLPGKSLLMLQGHSIVEHVYRAASQVSAFSEVFIATDDQRIVDAVTEFGGKAIMTSSEHASGTDRLVEAVDFLGCLDDEIIINIQGDEPLISPDVINLCYTTLADCDQADWSTLVYPIVAEKASNPNLVKAVMDINGKALYFSRATIPFERDGDTNPRRYGHAGIYGYRAAVLRRFTKLAAGKLESCEKLEQLRALENGMHIQCGIIDHATIGIDTLEDYQTVKKMLIENPNLSNI